jgi:hypothetical protein
MTLEEAKNRIEDWALLRAIPVRNGSVSLYKGNILVIRFADDVVVTVEDVIEMSNATLSLTGDAPYFGIVVTGQRQEVTREAREFDFYKELGRKPRCKAEAVIVKDLPTRIVTDFYYKFRRFPFPCKVFSREEKAIDWFMSLDPFFNP